MRIVIISQYFLPEMGAPQSRLYEMAMGLQERGWNITVVTAMPNYPTGKIFDQYKGRFTSSESIDGLNVKRYWLYASNSARIFPRIISMLSFSFTALFACFFIRKRKPQYLLVESPPLALAFTGWLLSRFSGSKFIMNVSDIWPLSAKELGVIGDDSLYRLLEKLEHFLYQKSFLCTGQSEEIVRHIQQVTSRVHLFRNGVNVGRFADGEYDPAKRNYIVYAGLLGVAQGVLSICKNINFKELGVEFHIYGSGAEQKLVEQFVQENPSVGVKYLGIIPRDKMPSVLSSYGCALIPLVKNIYGAVPSKIYEAMAAGLPILFSGEGEGAEIISRHDAGWVNLAGDWSALRKNIVTFMQAEHEEFLRRREANKLVAIQFFDRKKQVEKLSNVLSN